MSELRNLEFEGVKAVEWPSLPKIISLKLENVRYEADSVEGYIVLKYEFNGLHEVRQHFKARLNQQVSLPLGPLTIHFHVWLNGSRLCFGLNVCAGPICTGELTTCVDVPH